MVISSGDCVEIFFPQKNVVLKWTVKDIEQSLKSYNEKLRIHFTSWRIKQPLRGIIDLESNDKQKRSKYQEITKFALFIILIYKCHHSISEEDIAL